MRFISSLRWPLSAAVAVGLTALPAAALADNNVGSAGPFTYVEDYSAPAAAPGVMTTDAACPAGTHVSGGGVVISAGSVAAARAVSSYPIDGSDSDRVPDDGWSVLGWVDSGSDRQITATAICAAFRVTYVTRRVTVPALGVATLKAPCPGNRHVTGGGVRIAGPGDLVKLNSSAPFDGSDRSAKPDDGWRARVSNSGLGVRMKVFAICANQRLRYTSIAVLDPTYTFAVCPGSTHASGGGVVVSGPASQSHVLTIDPYAATVNPPDTGFITTYSNDVGAPKTVTSYAICAA